MTDVVSIVSKFLIARLLLLSLLIEGVYVLYVCTLIGLLFVFLVDIFLSCALCT